MGSVRHMQVMCLAFPQCTANERSRAGPLGGRMPISQNVKTKTSRSVEACRIWREQGSLQVWEILQQCF